MKKYFKNPTDAKKSDTKAVVMALKKVLGKGVEGSKFFYKAEFEYETGEKGPFLYIGAPAGHWKKFIKDSKKDKDFVAGVCKLDAEALLMKAELGKGSKAVFLKAVNKELLRKAGVKAEFVEDLTVNIQPVDGDEEESPEEVESASTQEAPAEKLPSPQEMSTKIKDLSDTFKNIRAEHSPEDIDTLLDQLADWQDNYESLPVAQQQALAPALTRAQELSKFLQTTNQIDSRIEQLLEKIYPLMDTYIDMEDHDSDEAKAMKTQLEKAIGKVEDLAKKINDNDFLEACQEFRDAIAD